MINGESVIDESIQVQNYDVLRMQKKIFSKLGKLKWMFLLGVIFTCILLCSQTNVKATEYIDSQGVKYLYSGKTAYVSGFDPSLIADVVIPKIITPPSGVVSYVVDIGDGAFAIATSLKTIDIQAEIRTIGRHAFFACPLTSARIPVNLDTLDIAAFSNCDDLEKVVFYGRLQKYKNLSISTGAFSFCSKLQKIYLPFNVSVVEESAFFSSNSLVSVILPTNVVSVGDFAYARIGNLSYLTVMNKDTTFAANAFDSTTVTNLLARTGRDNTKIPYTNLTETPYFVTFNQQYDGIYDVAGVTQRGHFTPPIYKVDPPPDPTRTGYTFKGWYKEPACINLWDFIDKDAIPLPPNQQDVILYAGWLLTPIPTEFTYWSQTVDDEEETLKCISTSSSDIKKISETGFVPGEANDLIGLSNQSDPTQYVGIFLNGADRIVGKISGAGGASPPIPPDMDPSVFGQGEFIEWQSIYGPGTIDGSNVNINNGNTVFKATYGAAPTFEIGNSENIEISPSGSSFSFGDTLTITCTDTANFYAMLFEGEQVSLSNPFKFIVIDGGTFSYATGVPSEGLFASLGPVNYDSDTQKLTFIAQRSVPLNYAQVVDSGVLLLQSDSAPLVDWDLNTPGVLRVSRPKTNKAFGSVVVSKCEVLDADKTKWYGKAYVIAKQTDYSPDEIILSDSKQV